MRGIRPNETEISCGRVSWQTDGTYFPSGAVGFIGWLGVASEPVLEACRGDARGIAGNEALIIHRDAGVERLGIGDYRPCVPGCGQELPHEVVLPNPF